MRPDRRPPAPLVLTLTLTLASTAMLAWATARVSAADGSGSVPSDPPFTALRTDGSAVTGRLRGLDARGSLVLAVDDKERSESIPVAALVKLTREGTPPPTSAAAGEGGIVLFPDGDRLHRSVIGPAGEATIEVQSFALGTLAVPLDSLLGLVLAPPVDPDASGVLTARVRDEPRAGEVLWLSNGDRLVGGLLGVDDKKVAFQANGSRLELDRSGVVAIGFDPKLATYPLPEGPFSELTLVDGSRLGVVSTQVEGGHLLATTRSGLAVKVPLAELAAVHPRNGAVAYLSDRAPTLDKYVSYLGPARPARPNLAVDGGPLRLGGRQYDRGIGTQSRSYLVYGLEPGVRRFQATVGVDDRAGPLGSVVFRVVVNGKDVYASPPMSAREAPRAVDVDVSGAKTLVLITDFGERGGVRDHADWVEARLVR